jgi:hypothetical protein
MEAHRQYEKQLSCFLSIDGSRIRQHYTPNEANEHLLPEKYWKIFEEFSIDSSHPLKRLHEL